MQLQAARLCLDCEEVHDEQQCPVCASETFAALSRWVPAADRRGRPRPTVPPEAEVYRALLGKPPASRGQRFLKRGALGLTAVGLIGWFLRSGKMAAKTVVPSATGEGSPPDNPAGTDTGG
ncbi:MAG: hypothetical protein ABI868_12340 [Acidobacteriota bacterium]